MKKIIINTGLSLLLILTFTGCEKQLDDLYNNPEKSTTPSLPGFFTSVLNNNRVRPSYWNVRTFLVMQPAVYSQTASFSIAPTMYQQNDGYTGQYWSGFYAPDGNGSGVVGMYRAMEAAYEKLSDKEKADQEIYMQAASVVLYDQASQMVDLWGDIPFSEAGSLEATSAISNSKFDKQAELYSTFIDGLKTAAAYFHTATANPSFSKADILLKGNIDLWQRYANSIRLRLLLRTSKVNESTVKTEVLTMLNNSADYPLVDGGGIGNYNPASSDILLTKLTNYLDNLNSALTELRSHPAPDYMLNQVMIPSNDPRIPVMFDKYGQTVGSVFTPNSDYAAMPITFTAAQQDAEFEKYSILDSATFLQNPGLPGIVITASEVNFLKAEAFERWGSSSDAQAAYETAVKQSITFYHYLNSLNTTGLKLVAKPADSDIDTFVSSSTISYTGTSDDKLELIWIQKWLHFGVLQSTQAWSEYRRTNYPVLDFPAATLSGYQNPPARLLYPSVETSYNTVNYQSVQAANTRTATVFWDID